jgi:trigger factor
LKVTREEASPREVILNIELESTDVQPFLDSSYDRVANRIQIPGFRPGRAPRFLVENYVSREAMVRDSLDAILQQTLDRAIEDESLDIFGQPDVELLEVDPVSYKAVVPLEPVVQLQDLDSIHLEPESVEVTEEQVDQVMEQLRYDAAPWEPADRTVKYGDLLNLNVE